MKSKIYWKTNSSESRVFEISGSAYWRALSTIIFTSIWGQPPRDRYKFTLHNYVAEDETIDNDEPKGSSPAGKVFLNNWKAGLFSLSLSGKTWRKVILILKGFGSGVLYILLIVLSKNQMQLVHINLEEVNKKEPKRTNTKGQLRSTGM